MSAKIKFCLSAVSALLIYLIYIMINNGLQVSNIEILPYSEIISKSNEVKNKLSEINKLNKEDLISATNKVNEEIAGFTAKKTEYEDLEAKASKEEIAEANKKQEYLLDYLWIVIGNYANDNNVKFKMTTDDVNLRINFDITGSYISIINFIYDLENDSNLRFNLNGIQLASSSSADTTKASFSVDGVTVKTSNFAEEM